MNMAQALRVSEFHTMCHRSVGPRGGIKESSVIWRRNGQTKLWKTRPTEFRIPVKFGMYSFDYITQSEVAKFHSPDTCPLLDKEWVGLS
jgi:hypothetical protein